MIVAREKVWIGIPMIDRRIDIGCVTGLFQVQHYYEKPFFTIGISNISGARNKIAHIFMEHTEYEWFMMIDSDIVFNPQDWELLWEGDEDVVIAAYAKKIIGERPTDCGAGFARVHRSVFQRIKDMLKEDGSELAQRYYENGEMMINYFPTGPNMDALWLGEDYSFWSMCAMANVKPRFENRTRLRHVGYFEYGYPNQLTVEQVAQIVATFSPAQVEQLVRTFTPPADDGAN